MEGFLLLLIFLLLSFIFSGYETAFFSVSEGKRDGLSFKYPFLNIRKLNENRNTLLNVLLLMNLLVNTLNAFVFAQIVERLNLSSANITLFVQIFGFFIILLIFGEITPKVIAIRAPEFFLKYFSVFIYMVYRLIGWFVRPVTLYLKLILSRFQKEEIDVEDILYELKTLFPRVDAVFTGIGIARGSIRRIMKDKKYVVEIKKNMPVEEIDRIVIKHPHSTYPVIDVNMEVNGTLNLRFSYKERICFEDISVIPETLSIPAYMKEVEDDISGFRAVVSEHGDYIGIVTIDDILKVLVPSCTIKNIGDNRYLIEGGAHVEDVERKIGITLNTDAETLMGYIMEKTQRIPDEGEKIVIDNMFFEILAKKEGEIKLLKLEIE